MKKVLFILFSLCFAIFCSPLCAQSLNEAQLFTSDKECQLHYLTTKNLTGWTFKIEQGECQNKLVQGQMTLSVFNAFKQPVEQISGWFNQGYWIGSTPLQKKVLTRSSDKETQKLTFLIGKDSLTQATFIGQMNADMTKNGQYGPFILCEPMKILVVSENTKLFNEQTNQISLFEQIQQDATELCPNQDTVMLFGSTKIEPKQEDIFFYADLNVKQENALILKTPNEVVKSLAGIQHPQATTVLTKGKNLSDTQQLTKTGNDWLSLSPTVGLERIQALLLFSKIRQAPAEGYFPVQLDKINPDNSVLLEKQGVLLKGTQLKPGTQVVFGKMTAEQTAPNQPLNGVFQITRSIPCENNDCAPILEKAHAF